MLIKLDNKFVCNTNKHLIFRLKKVLKICSKWKIDLNYGVRVILRKPLVHRIARKGVNKTFMASNIVLRYILERDYFEAILSVIASCTLLCRRQLRTLPSCPKQVQNYHSADKPFVILGVPDNLPRNAWMDTLGDFKTWCEQVRATPYSSYLFCVSSTILDLTSLWKIEFLTPDKGDLLIGWITSTIFEFQTSDVFRALALHVGFWYRV